MLNVHFEGKTIRRQGSRDELVEATKNKEGGTRPS